MATRSLSDLIAPQIVHLVVKTLLRQFDIPKAKATKDVNEEDKELYELAEEDNNEVEGDDKGDFDRDADFLLPTGAEGGDDNDRWVDEVAAMMESSLSARFGLSASA